MATINEENKETTQATPAPKSDPRANMFEGKVVSMIGNRLVMTNKEGKEHSHTLSQDARLTCDGATCKAEDVKAGNKVRVTTKQDDRNVVTCIESLDKKSEFAHCG